MKTYGWGWGFPCTWEGWVVFVGYLVLLAGAGFYFDPRVRPFAFGGTVFVLTGVLIGICAVKGEPPKLRSGTTAS